MEPEIARRCKTCGAAVRNHAGFCPQCGASLNPEESNPASTVGASESQL
ncbi:MAG: zinc ribbon domain-containing protein, partial [Acidobacteria bacterium]|nr:zinc ribbon domain-containing protein [Acidobacteriota bacterium]